MKNKWIFISLIIMFISYFVGINYIVSAEDDSFVLNGVRVEIEENGGEFVDSDDVLKILKSGFGDIKGKSFTEIKRDSIEKCIESSPYIESAEVYKCSNSFLKIQVRQRTPLFRVLSSSGDYYIDVNGSVMPVSHKYTARVLIVSGNLSRKKVSENLYDFCKFVLDNEFWCSFIEQIHIENSGDVVLIPKLDKFTILLGSVEDYENRMSKLKLFLDKGKENNIWGKYREINLKYRNQVVCVK